MSHDVTRRGAVIRAAASFAALIAAYKTTWAGTPVTHMITIKAFRFDPQHIVAQPGDTLRWTNRDLAPHTATADKLGWDTGGIEKGESHDIKVTGDMETRYFCAFHPHMTGTIKVIRG